VLGNNSRYSAEHLLAYGSSSLADWVRQIVNQILGADPWSGHCSDRHHHSRHTAACRRNLDARSRRTPDALIGIEADRAGIDAGRLDIGIDAEASELPGLCWGETPCLPAHRDLEDLVVSDRTICV
jgi:hypothetical protein